MTHTLLSVGVKNQHFAVKESYLTQDEMVHLEKSHRMRRPQRVEEVDRPRCSYCAGSCSIQPHNLMELVEKLWDQVINDHFWGECFTILVRAHC